MTSYDTASDRGGYLTRRSVRFPRLSAWLYGRRLRSGGYTRKAA